MTRDFLLLCAACPAVAGVVVSLLRQKNARGMKTRILRDLIGLETIWEGTGSNSRA